MASLRSLFLRPQQLRSSLASSISSPSQSTARIAIRAASTSSTAAHTTESSATKPPLVPNPTPFIPDVETFLKVIGRGLRQHSAKFPTWESLFQLSSDQLRDLGVEPPRTRKYLLRWRNRFRLGQFGVGGDLQHVQDGSAVLKVLNVQRKKDVGHVKRYVVNVPPGQDVDVAGPDQMSRVTGYKVKGTHTIAGPYALPMKSGEGSIITITEGMWEDKRGHKIDGGERRRTEVRYKKRVAERRERRERGEH